MSFENIVQGILNYIDGVVGLPDIYYPNSKNPSRAQPPSDEHLTVDILPVDTDAMTVNDSSEYPGLLQVVVNVKADTGVLRSYVIADLVLTAFNPRTEITESGTIIGFDVPGTVAPALPGGDGWYRLPITLPYRVFE